MTNAEALVWQVRAQTSVRTLWLGRHEDVHARERIHGCVRLLRMIQGHRYRPHAAVMTANEIGAAIEGLIDRQQKEQTTWKSATT